jgi:hypothetical protein
VALPTVAAFFLVFFFGSYSARLRLDLSYTLVCSNKLSVKNKHANAPIYMMKELLTSTFHPLKFDALQPRLAAASAPQT